MTHEFGSTALGTYESDPEAHDTPPDEDGEDNEDEDGEDNEDEDDTPRAT